MSTNTPIICDINIWYMLSDGRILPESVKDEQLIGTYINGYEFCCTPNILKDYNKFRNAVKAFKQYPRKYFGEWPVEYIKMLSNLKSCIPGWDQMNRKLDEVINTEEFQVSEVTRTEYSRYTDELAKAVIPFMEMVEKHREQILVKAIHKKRMNDPLVRVQHKEVTVNVLNQLMGSNNIDWGKFELFVNTFDEWLRQLSIQPSLKMTSNDWNDLMNLVYVQPGSKYWTHDNKKTKVFIRDCGCGHYLF
ncbi:hypothetical protein [Arsenicibacter rosenii]|uniref:Uncharacterized protein n=1 Tax=Arsenicibacter rosenii TaxID=1750698 RepID=A0A1S2VC79_9BACT|nr:hypothetical protein [Arsenicibacter rosenii]OIN56324.1 hypothetical protein BLX24_25150 [Arsenicibacter rosenii]